MGEFISLVFIIWFLWYLLKVITQGNSSHSSKIDSGSGKIDYRKYGPIKQESRNSEVIPRSKEKHPDLVAYYNNIKDKTSVTEVAAAQYNLGNAKWNSKDYSGAISEYTKAIEINPNYDKAYNNRASAKLELKDYTGAIADFTKAIEINPNHPNAYTNRDIAQQCLKEFQGGMSDSNKTAQDLYESANLKYENKDYEGAIDDLSKAIGIDPDNSLFYFKRGLSISKKKWRGDKDAIADFSKAIEIDSSNSLFYYQRGLAKSLSDEEGSIADFSKAIEIDPNNAKAYFERGAVKDLGSGDTNGKIDDYNKAIKIDPNNSDYYVVRGGYKGFCGDYQDAIQDFTKAIQLNSKNYNAYKERGDAKSSLGDLTGAINDYTIAIKINPEEEDGYTFRGKAKDKLGDLEGAIIDYEKSLEINPKDSYVNLFLATAKEKIGDVSQTKEEDYEESNSYLARGIENLKNDNYKAAIVDFNKAIDLNTSNAFAYYNRYVARNFIGISEGDGKETMGAMDDYSIALGFSPFITNLYTQIASKKIESSNYEEAISDLNLAIKINPKDDDAYSIRGIAKKELGDTQGAIDDCSKAIDINPRNPFNYLRRGDVGFSESNYQSCFADYNKSIEIDPTNEVVYINRGELKSFLKDYQGAIDDYTKAIEIKPEAANDKGCIAYIARGESKKCLGDLIGAREDWNKAKDLGFELASLFLDGSIQYTETEDYRSLGKEAFYEKQDFKEAIEMLTKAIEKDPEDAFSFDVRGRSKMMLGDTQGSLEDFNKAVEITPDNEDLYVLRGHAYKAIGNTEKAIADYTKAIEINPKLSNAYYARGTTKQSANDLNGACSDWALATKLGDPDAMKLFEENCQSIQEEYIHETKNPNFVNTSKKSVIEHRDFFNEMLLGYWGYTPFAENNPIPMMGQQENDDGSIYFRYYPGTKENVDRLKGSYGYTIKEGGIVKVMESAEILNLNDFNHLIAIISTIITDIYGEYDKEKAFTNFFNFLKKKTMEKREQEEK